MSHEVRRKIVGECDVIEEYVRMDKETKYVMVETTYKTFTQHIVLDCGHVVAKSKYSKVPQSNTRCEKCSEIEEDNSTDPSDMTCWQNWRVGDVLICMHEVLRFRKGALYRIKSTCTKREYLSFFSKDGLPDYSYSGFFKFHHRPASEVEAPYAVERVKHPPLPLPYKDYVNFKPKEQSK